MPSLVVRRWAYRLAAVLALVYATYVLVLKFQGRVMGGPLGEVGEFVLVLVAVSAFAVGLFADEAYRRRAAPAAGAGDAGPEV
jgi:uncharacterized membrane protein (DUF485 family)